MKHISIGLALCLAFCNPSSIVASPLVTVAALAQVCSPYVGKMKLDYEEKYEKKQAAIQALDELNAQKTALMNPCSDLCFNREVKKIDDKRWIFLGATPSSQRLEWDIYLVRNTTYFTISRRPITTICTSSDTSEAITAALRAEQTHILESFPNDNKEDLEKQIKDFSTATQFVESAGSLYKARNLLKSLSTSN